MNVAWVASQNEAGAVNGRPRVVRPHRDFRLILAMDPRHGEVSRAMRNRGVELFLLPQQADDGSPETFSQVDCWHSNRIGVAEEHCTACQCCLSCVRPSCAAQRGKHPRCPACLCAHFAFAALDHIGLRTLTVDSQSEDLEGLLALEGVPGAALPAAMAATHAAAVAASTAIGRTGPTRRELRQWASLARELLQRGWAAPVALAAAWQQVCIPRLSDCCSLQ